jgi:hypothetical protein
VALLEGPSLIHTHVEEPAASLARPPHIPSICILSLRRRVVSRRWHSTARTGRHLTCMPASAPPYRRIGVVGSFTAGAEAVLPAAAVGVAVVCTPTETEAARRQVHSAQSGIHPGNDDTLQRVQEEIHTRMRIYSAKRIVSLDMSPIFVDRRETVEMLTSVIVG